uniref:Single stranded DNA binding protein 4 n=1 Tax=Labrus bergylta TaxID=56723 RepID=A0A3Q3EDJ7_9LABR
FGLRLMKNNPLCSPPSGSGDMDGLPKSSPNNMGGMNNPPGTPRDDGEMGGNFLNPFQSESYSPNMTMSV